MSAPAWVTSFARCLRLHQLAHCLPSNLLHGVAWTACPSLRFGGSVSEADVSSLRLCVSV